MATVRKLGAADVADALRRQAGARVATPAARIWLALATVYLLWGSTYLGIKYAIATIPQIRRAFCCRGANIIFMNILFDLMPQCSGVADNRGPQAGIHPAQYRSPLGRRPYDLRH